MAATSGLFSFASRFLSVRSSQAIKWIHMGNRSLAAIKDNPLTDDISGSSEDKSFLEVESTVVPDIEVDDTLTKADFFQIRKLCTPQLLFRHKVHYGHKASSLEPGMRQFVYGTRSNHIIFDLDITSYHFQEALNFAAHIALRDGIILFVARLPHCSNLIEQTAKDCGEFAHTRTWREGTLTDIRRVQAMECRLPDLLIFLSTVSEFGSQHVAVREAAKLNIPTIAIVDSNCNPNLVTYPIPGNDDSVSAVELYCSLFKEAILRGKKERATRVQSLEKESTKETFTPSLKL